MIIRLLMCVVVKPLGMCQSRSNLHSGRCSFWFASICLSRQIPFQTITKKHMFLSRWTDEHPTPKQTPPSLPHKLPANPSPIPRGQGLLGDTRQQLREVGHHLRLSVPQGFEIEGLAADNWMAMRQLSSQIQMDRTEIFATGL